MKLMMEGLFLIIFFTHNKTESIYMRLVDTVHIMVDSPSADWNCKGGAGLLLLSLRCSLPFSHVSWGGKEEKGQRRLTSAGGGEE